MIEEGIVNITPKEEKAIDIFISEISKFYNRRIKIHKTQSDEEIITLLDEYVNGYLAPKLKLNRVNWRFIYNIRNHHVGLFDPQSNTITLNISNAVDYPSNPLNNQRIDLYKMSHYIYHEWVHFKQNELYKQSTGHDLDVLTQGNIEYFDDPWEQMAFAYGEIEWIKQNIKKTDPKLVIKWLQKWGLLQGDRLSKLKRNNYTAYKKILKYAVLFLLKKQAQKAIKSKK